MGRDRLNMIRTISLGAAVCAAMVCASFAAAQDSEPERDDHIITVEPESIDGGGGEIITTPPLELKFEVKPALDPSAPLPSLETDPSAGNLLDHLERNDAGLRRLSAQIQYTRVQSLQGDTQTRNGQLYYARGSDLHDGAMRRFAIEFETLIVDDAQRDERTAWVFDGQWLVEKDYQTRQFVKRRIAAPGEETDPLRLGNGNSTIPLPIGQRRADVERYFNAELVGALEGLVPDSDAFDDPDENYRKFVSHMGGGEGVAGVYQLKLTPLEGTPAAEDYRVIRLWYQKGTLIPMMSRAIDRKRDISTVVMFNVDTQSEIPDRVTSTALPPEDENWDVRVEDRMFDDQ